MLPPTGLLIALGRLSILLLITGLLAGVRWLLILLITGLLAAGRRMLILLITVGRILRLLRARLLRTGHGIGVKLRFGLLADRCRLLTEQSFKKIELTRLGVGHFVRCGSCARRRVSCCILDCSGRVNGSGVS